MSIQDILDKKLLLFAGKGGVGKTTCAAASAIALYPKKTLLASLDPAHSLADCLGHEIGDRVGRVGGTEHLYAVEISPARAIEEFKQRHRRAMLRVLETAAGFQYLTPREREGLLSLPIPGLDEALSFRAVLDCVDEGSFETCVIDTAPTAYALRLLSMPDVFEAWAETFYGLTRQRRQAAGALSQSDLGDLFLREINESARRLRDSLRSADTEFVIVASAERLAIEETKDLVSHLRAGGVPVRRVIVNKLFPELGDDFSRLRREEERARLVELKSAMAEQEVYEAPLLAREPRGLEQLTRFAAFLYGMG